MTVPLQRRDILGTMVAEGSNSDQAKVIVYPVNAAHLMRTTQLAQLQLSAMADTKASILMGATFVIFTITISQAHVGSAPLPLLILGAAAFFSAIFAVLAVLPMIRAGRPRTAATCSSSAISPPMGEEEFIGEITGRARHRGQHLPDDGARHLPERHGAPAQEIPDARLCLSHLAARAGREQRRLRPHLFLTGSPPISAASPAPCTSPRSP